MSSFDLSGKVAIVTGASRGIGASIAQTYAASGAQVVVSSRTQETIDQVTKAITDQGHQATAIACHVGREDQLQALVEKTMETYGRIDIVVNNAATNPVFGPLEEASGTLFDKIMNINVKAPMLLSNLCHPMMKKNGSGSIINIASVEGLKPGLGLGVYSTTKAALIMLSQNQAKEWGKYGIRSNTISPGLIKTKFSKALWENPQLMGFIENHLPLSRIGTTDELTGIALFLASSAGSYTTGSNFVVDGGFMMT